MSGEKPPDRYPLGSRTGVDDVAKRNVLRPQFVEPSRPAVAHRGILSQSKAWAEFKNTLNSKLTFLTLGNVTKKPTRLQNYVSVVA
jgi:hypothetical protein